MRGIHTFTWLTQRATLGAQIALLDDSQVLLVRHIYKAGWHLPGGGIDPPEDPRDAAARELLEETSYTLLSPPKLLGIFSNMTAATRRDYVTLFTSDEFIRPKEQTRTSLEISEVSWFSLDALPPGTDQMCLTALRVLQTQVSNKN
jgi:8-oxo-dGTP pyrophosphatase MutT (NUDIX family)